ncbi:MAG: ATP-binding SpoIIE family protein phosphatase, partial [bacterium]
GKGFDASLLMVRTSSLLRWTGKQGLAPDEWLRTVNAELAESVSRGMFICAAAGYYDPETGVLEWANAGFPPALKLGRDGQFEDYIASAPPLAILPDIEPVCETVNLDNACILFYSDGVTESLDDQGEQLGVEGLESIVRTVRENSPAQRMRVLMARLRQMKLTDDTTMLLIEDRERWEEVILEFGFTADPKNLAMLRTHLRKHLHLLEVTDFWIDQLLLVANEACANIIRHGYHGDENGKIMFSLTRDKENLSLVFRDYAKRVDKECIQPRDLSECRPGGLGINIIDSLMDEWGFQQLENEGNLLIMRKALHTLRNENEQQ